MNIFTVYFVIILNNLFFLINKTFKPGITALSAKHKVANSIPRKVIILMKSVRRVKQDLQFGERKARLK